MDNSAIGLSWGDFEKEFYTPEEIEASHRRARKMVMRDRHRMRKRRRERAEIFKRISK